MTYVHHRLIIAVLLINLLPGLWNIFVAVLMTSANGYPAEVNFLSAVWTKFGSFGPVESFLGNVAFFIVTIWQTRSLTRVVRAGYPTGNHLAYGTGFMAVAIHVGMHLAMGVFTWGDLRIAASIFAGVLVSIAVERANSRST